MVLLRFKAHTSGIALAFHMGIGKLGPVKTPLLAAEAQHSIILLG